MAQDNTLPQEIQQAVNPTPLPSNQLPQLNPHPSSAQSYRMFSPDLKEVAQVPAEQVDGVLSKGGKFAVQMFSPDKKESAFVPHDQVNSLLDKGASTNPDDPYFSSPYRAQELSKSVPAGSGNTEKGGEFNTGVSLSSPHLLSDFYNKAKQREQQIAHFLSYGAQTLSGDPTGAVVRAALEQANGGTPPSDLINTPIDVLSGTPQPHESIMLPSFMDEQGNTRKVNPFARAMLFADSLMGGDVKAAQEDAAKGKSGAVLADLFTGGPEFAAAAQASRLVGEPKVPSPLDTQPHQERAYNALNKKNAAMRDERGKVSSDFSTLPQIRNEAAKDVQAAPVTAKNAVRKLLGLGENYPIKKGAEGTQQIVDLTQDAIDSHDAQVKAVAQPFSNQTIDLRPAAAEARAQITPEMRAAAQANPSGPEARTIAAIEDLANQNDGVMTMQDAFDRKHRYNDELASELGKPEASQDVSPALTQAKRNAASALRNAYYQRLYDLSGQDVRPLAQTEGRLIEAKGELTKAQETALRSARNDTGRFPRLGGAGTALKSVSVTRPGATIAALYRAGKSLLFGPDTPAKIFNSRSRRALSDLGKPEEFPPVPNFNIPYSINGQQEDIPFGPSSLFDINLNPEPPESFTPSAPIEGSQLGFPEALGGKTTPTEEAGRKLPPVPGAKNPPTNQRQGSLFSTQQGGKIAPNPPSVSGGSPSSSLVGSAEGAAADTAYFQQAKQMLGPNASISDVAKKAQELKMSKTSLPPQLEEVLQGGHAGSGVSSEEELSRPGKNFVVSKSGQLTFHGKSFDPGSTPPGSAHVTLLPDGSVRVNEGSLNPVQERAVRGVVKELGLGESGSSLANQLPEPIAALIEGKMESKENPTQQEVLDFARSKQTLGISDLRQKFNISVPQAVRMIDQLEEEGVLSAPQGSGPRKVLQAKAAKAK